MRCCARNTRNIMPASASPPLLLQVHLLFLRSWRGMGRALVECEGGCECEATELEGHWERQATLTDLYTLQVGVQHAAWGARWWSARAAASARRQS